MVRLDEFCTFSAGGKTRVNKGHYVDEGYPAFSAAGQDGFVENWEYDRPAVVVTSIGTCGKAYLATGKWTSLANTYIVFPDTEICHPDYLLHVLDDESSWFVSGSVQPFIKPADIKARKVPLPSLDRQLRIARILNRAAGVERLHCGTVDRARKFAPALFAGMFGDPVENPMGWEMRKLDEIADLSTGDPAPQDPEAFAPDGPLFVRMQDVGRGHVNPELAESTDRLNPAWLRENRLRVFPRDSLLIPKSGASVNLNHRAMLAVDAHVVSHLAIAAPHRSAVDPVYLFWWSVHYDPREHAQVTTLPSLKLSVLRQAEVPLPPLDLQRRFAAIAKGAARMASRAKAAAGAASALTAALAARLLEESP